MEDKTVLVAVRSRPLLKDETPSSYNLRFEGSTVKLHQKSYAFDIAFQPNATNKEVYDTIIANKIPRLFEGYNVTILAYGTTGSGKTYSMGTDYNPKKASSNTDTGIIPRVITEIFQMVESLKDSKDFIVRVSFLELYHDNIYDLLKKKAVCYLGENRRGVAKVLDLSKLIVQSAEEAFVQLGKGCVLRRTGTTAKNLKSSRSHAMFSVYIQQADKGTTTKFKHSKFQLVDLAGSERVGSSKTVGKQIKEGIDINLGLLTLGKVITHLIHDNPHIPYREAKLTRLLQDSLGGNSHTVMMACVNPSVTNLEETLSTLRYASNARRIKNRPKINVDPPLVQIRLLKEKIEQLQIALYNKHQSGNTSATYIDKACGEEKSVAEVEQLQLELHQAYSKISALAAKINMIEEKNENLIQNILQIYEKIKLVATEMTTEEAVSEEMKEDFIKRLNDIQEQCYVIAMQGHVTTLEHDESIDSENMQSSLEEPEDMDPTSEFKLENIKEMTNKQKHQNKNLESIDHTLRMKCTQVEYMTHFYKNYESTVNEDYLKNLINKIQELVEEKNKLEEEMKMAEERVRTESQQKVETYEKQISDLRTELHKKQVVLQAKTENQAKINALSSEIVVLKKNKVQLLKQMKQDSNKYLQIQREKEREVAKLVKEGRHKEHELVKMKNKFDKEVNVLKQKIDRVTSIKNSQIIKKHGKNGVVKPSSSTSQENIEERIIEELKNKINEEVSKRQYEILEKESESLKQQIKSMEELSDVAEGTNMDEPDVNSQKALIEIIDKRISGIKESIKEGSDKTSTVLESVKSMGQAKAAMEILFKKCTSEAVELEISQFNYQEQLRKEQLIKDQHVEKISTLEHDIEMLNQNIESNKFEQEQEKSNMKVNYDLKILQLVAEFHKEMKSSDVSPDLKEKIENQDKEIQNLQSIHNDYDKKCQEVAMLQQQLFQAKKGNKATWLGNMSVKPLKSASSDENTATSMLDEYLSDSQDESFPNDPKDPDWRLTPAYRRRKRRHVPEPTQVISEETDTSSPNKKPLILCRCRTDCSSMRCMCRKHEVICNNQCGCVKEECSNFEKVGIKDVTNTSFLD